MTCMSIGARYISATAFKTSAKTLTTILARAVRVSIVVAWPSNDAVCTGSESRTALRYATTDVINAAELNKTPPINSDTTAMIFDALANFRVDSNSEPGRIAV